MVALCICNQSHILLKAVRTLSTSKLYLNQRNAVVADESWTVQCANFKFESICIVNSSRPEASHNLVNSLDLLQIVFLKVPNLSKLIYISVFVLYKTMNVLAANYILKL